MSDKSEPPVILCLSGHDPSGGAGIQADIESIAAQNCHAVTAITCLTAQDTSSVHALQSVPCDIFRKQMEIVLDDSRVAAIKIGLLGSVEIARTVTEVLAQHARIPVVLDPVLHAGDGNSLAGHPIVRFISEHILPLTTLATPNKKEARLLSGEKRQEKCAGKMLQRGCRAVLVTGADESDGGEVVNKLYQGEGEQTWHWPKLPLQYHGSGCTLAAAAAAGLAKGAPIERAVEQAQRYTWETLKHAQQTGKGQATPNRLHVCQR